MVNSQMIEGYRALKNGDLESAFGTFKSLLSSEADDRSKYEALLGIGLTYDVLGKREEALEYLEKALDYTDEPVEALFNIGNMYEKNGEHALAIQHYDHTITEDEKFYRAYINRGVAWYNTQKYEQGLKDFQNSLKYAPNSTVALTNIGICNLDLGKFEVAIDFFDRSLEKDHENIHALLGKGLALYNMDRYDESIICFDAAVSINEDFYIAYYYKGYIMRKLDLLDEAKEALEEAVGIRPDYSLAWFELGIINTIDDEIDEALTCFDRAIKHNRTFFEEAVFKKGKILLDKKNDPGRAIKEFKSICKVNPYVPLVWHELGRALLKEGGEENVSKAIDALMNVLNLQPDNIEATNILAKALVENEEPEKALLLLRKSMMNSPTSRNQLLIADIQLEYGKPRESIRAAEEALALDPLNARAWLTMGRAYKKIHRKEEYKQCLRKYLNHNPNDNNVKEELASA